MLRVFCYSPYALRESTVEYQKYGKNQADNFRFFHVGVADNNENSAVIFCIIIFN